MKHNLQSLIGMVLVCCVIGLFSLTLGITGQGSHHISDQQTPTPTPTPMPTPAASPSPSPSTTPTPVPEPEPAPTATATPVFGVSQQF
jgi:hypothetical protein